MHPHPLHDIFTGLVRRTWLVVLISVLGCAAFAARAVAALVEASYLAPDPHGVTPLAPRSQPPRRTQPDGSALIARNMFCSSCVAITGGEPGPTDSFEPAAILIATSVGTVPRATLRVPATEVAGSWGLGELIPGIGRVAQIGWTQVELVDDRGRRGRLSLLASTATGGGDAGAATLAPADPFADRIKKIDDHTFEVDRSLVRELVTGSVKPGSARISPVTGKDGELKGLRMFGVRDGSLAAALGLKNADVLSDVNGTHIQSANTLLDLYGKLDTLSTVELDGTRAGKPLALTLRLR